MKNSKTILLSVATICLLLGLIVKAGQPSPTYALIGRVKINNNNAQAALPRYTARLYFPKETKRPVLLSYADGYGRFDFTKVPEGSFLLEVYANSEMVYQKSLRINSSTALDDRLVQVEVRNSSPTSEIRVVNKSSVKQGENLALQGVEFQGKLTVQVRDIQDNRRRRPFTLTISETGTNRMIVKPTQVPAPNVSFNFKYIDREYILTGTTRNSGPGSDYLDFEIYRK